jgi:glutathione S-transferase
MYTVYGDIYSGNCYKVKLLMKLLDIEHDWMHVDILAGESRTDTFVAMNPVGKIPTLRLPDGSFLFESNAILNYLATGSEFLPTDPLSHARILQWQFFEQYSHEPGVAVARFIRKYLGLPDERRDEYDAARVRGQQALAVMETHLADHHFFVDDRYTIADISLYAYTHIAGEGGFDLSSYPAIGAWLDQMSRQPGHATMAKLAGA